MKLMSDNRVCGVGWCGGASERIHKTLTRCMRVSRIFFPESPGDKFACRGRGTRPNFTD